MRFTPFQRMGATMFIAFIAIILFWWSVGAPPANVVHMGVDSDGWISYKFPFTLPYDLRRTWLDVSAFPLLAVLWFEARFQLRKRFAYGDGAMGLDFGLGLGIFYATFGGPISALILAPLFALLGFISGKRLAGFTAALTVGPVALALCVNCTVGMLFLLLKVLAVLFFAGVGYGMYVLGCSGYNMVTRRRLRLR